MSGRGHIIDMTGQRFGRLVVVSAAGKGNWHCHCDCGNSTTVYGVSLRRGTTRSCGCLRSKYLRARLEARGTEAAPVVPGILSGVGVKLSTYGTAKRSAEAANHAARMEAAGKPLAPTGQLSPVVIEMMRNAAAAPRTVSVKGRIGSGAANVRHLMMDLVVDLEKFGAEDEPALEHVAAQMARLEEAVRDARAARHARNVMVRLDHAAR